MHKVNILIAEDDKDDFLLLREAIEEVLPKFNIEHCTDGQQVIQAIDDDETPDLIFLDLNMPKKNGIDCLKDIRSRQKLDTTPVIIYSTSVNFEDIDICYKSGCTLYLVKPVLYKDLVNQIRKIFFRIGLPKKDLKSKEMFVVKKHE